MMKLLLKILAGVAVLLVVALVGVNLLISADAVRDRVAARVKEQSGRYLKVNGSTSLLFLPNPHIVLSDATITDPDARAGTADLSISRLELDLSFSELLSRQVDAERVVLVRPVLTVRLKPDAGAPDVVTPDAVTPEPRAAPERRGDAGPIVHISAAAEMAMPLRREVRLKDVRIEDGTVRIIYDAAGNERRVEHIEANLSLPRLTDPLTAHGKFEWKDVPTEFDLTLTTPADLHQERVARVTLGLKMQAIDATFEGNVATRPSFAADGEIKAKAQSIPSLLAWLKEKPASATAIGSGELASHVVWEDDTITFAQARFALSHATGQGQAEVTLKSPRPLIRAAFALDRLDISPFLEAPDGHAPIAGAGPTPPNPAAPPSAEGAAPQTGGVAPQARLAPSAPQPEPLAAPADFDADVNLNIHQTQAHRLTIGPSSLGLRYHEGVLVATLGSMELYEGQAKGTLTLDVSKPVASFTSDFALEGVSAEPLLKDAAEFGLLSGHAKMSLQLAGSGANAAAVTSSLSGRGTLAVIDGTIKGIDLTALITAIGAGQIPDLKQGPDAKTAFTDFGGSFTVASGLAESNDLEVTSPLLRVTARGTVDMVTGSLDFLTQPEIVAGPAGKGGANDLAGLSVPVRVEGPFAHPTFKPEIKGMFANPEQASKTVKQIGDVLQKKFKGKPVGEAIGRLLGSVRIGPQAGEQGAQEGTPPPANKTPPKADTPQQQSEEPDDPDLDRILR
jgi:AsmA protein